MVLWIGSMGVVGVLWSWNDGKMKKCQDGEMRLSREKCGSYMQASIALYS